MALENKERRLSLVTNREGLTWTQWLNAAYAFDQNKKVQAFLNQNLRNKLRKEWEDGVDPAEVALLLSKGKLS
jgi:hypothetical protein